MTHRGSVLNGPSENYRGYELSSCTQMDFNFPSTRLDSTKTPSVKSALMPLPGADLPAVKAIVEAAVSPPALAHRPIFTPQ
jgi:hypothetical protein